MVFSSVFSEPSDPIAATGLLSACKVVMVGCLCSRFRLTRVLPFCDGVFLVSYPVLRAMLILCLAVIQMIMLIVYFYYFFAV